MFFIACGAPNRVMDSIRYWVEREATGVETHLYYPAEFILQAPRRVDEKSMVVLISHSGKTPEVIQAARFLKEKYPCRVVSITSNADSPLAFECPVTLVHGQTPVGFEAKFMLLMALVSGWMQQHGEWDWHPQIMEGLRVLPAAMAEAEQQEKEKNKHFAQDYQREEFFMITGSGPAYPVAYSLGVCIMMEALWVKMFEGSAAEFFHGPFEIVNSSVPVILFKGEDPSRPVAERVERFCRQYTEKLLVYDSKDYPMIGVPEVVRPVFAPYILGAASVQLAEFLAELKDQPLTTRRYMGKVPY
jgi:fructoselysine-6-P-deglycase FrlB-like protein